MLDDKKEAIIRAAGSKEITIDDMEGHDNKSNTMIVEDVVTPDMLDAK